MVIRRIIDIFLLTVFAEGFCYASDIPELQERAVDLGGNITLPCTKSDESSAVNDSIVSWVREGREEIRRRRIQPDGALVLTDLEREDAGIYLCIVDSRPGFWIENGDVRARIRVEVRTPPPALVNVTVRPSTVLALLMWDVAEDGGYEITHFTIRFRQKYPSDDGQPNTWRSTLPEHISPTARQVDVYHLKPNTTYIFRLWANNQLGKGVVTVMEATTSHDTQEIVIMFAAELARHLLEGAENFDTRVWVAAVAVVMGTLLMLAIGTCYLLYKECHIPSIHRDEQEIIELVPNIILNPGFYDGDARTEEIEPDENSNNQATTRINNNTIVRPIRV
ncbi:protein turtle homolog A isoform X3 [Schistocerca americana]|uniref:protein turtle homolog A isoform X3 n=1 Tax=Schistocerca americana TaxID=7009 RepID=UPI001F4FD1E4|nr:protein turtle homolog A isoform X3 [Schistocerca americana]